MKIKVLGTGCKSCKTLEELANRAVNELNLEASVEKVEDFQQIMEYGILSTPGLVINEKVVVSGKVPKLEEIKEFLTQNQ